jgi:hypothetical protein
MACKSIQSSTDELSKEMTIIADWFDAWELVFNEVYELDSYRNSDFVFFDSTYVYSTSPETIENGIKIDGPDLLGEKLTWKKKPHNGLITLPTGEKAPLGLMVFTAISDSMENRPFFIMPLPQIWKSYGVQSDIGLDYFLTGVFVHEFSHTQQMEGIGNQITVLSKGVSFEENLNDEIVQQIFSEDSSYVSAFESEHSSIFHAISIDDTIEKKIKVRSILNSINERQDQYFHGEYQSFKELNPLFLTMEGVGQYTMYAWLAHPKGGNLEKSQAFNATRTKSWIQDEGFGLTILLAELENPKKWSEKVFGPNSYTIIDLLKNEINK